jgi:hypothetical protein
MNSPIDEIKKAVAENRTSDALSRLLELSKSDKQLHDAILIFSGEFRDLTMQQLKGVIDNKEATQRLNGVHDKILRALGAFDSEGQPVRGSDMVGKKSSSTDVLGYLAVIFVGLGIILFQGEKEFGFGLLGILLIYGGGIVFIGFVIALVVNAFKK